MNEIKIEIVAITEKAMYSIGTIVVSSKGDVYHISKFKNKGFHVSRHSSGKIHWKMNGKNFLEIENGKPITDFKGIEFLGWNIYGSLESFPSVSNEYKMKECNCIFSFDFREYQNARFYLSVAILTEQYLPKLLTASRFLKKRQVSIWADCHPMIAMIVGEDKNIEEIDRS